MSVCMWKGIIRKGLGCAGEVKPVPDHVGAFLCERHWMDMPTREITEPLVALKFDTKKLRMELIDPVVLNALASILTKGAEKYGAWNWAKGFKWSRLKGALDRHINAWYNCEGPDPEMQESHLHNAICCLAFLISHETRGLGEDDRPFTSRRPEAPTVMAPPPHRHDASGTAT